MLEAVLHPGMEAVGTPCRGLRSTLKVSVVTREAPPKLRDALLVNSQQDKKKVHQVANSHFLNSSKKWVVSDLGLEAVGTMPDGCCSRRTMQRQRHLHINRQT